MFSEKEIEQILKAIRADIEDGNLAKLIDQSDSMDEEELEEMGQKAKQRIKDEYSWQYICDKYTKVWEKN